MEHNHKRKLVPSGSDIKLAITITSLGDGRHITDPDVGLEVDLIVGPNVRTFKKVMKAKDDAIEAIAVDPSTESAELPSSDFIRLSDDTYLLAVGDTADFGKGDLFVVTRTSVPDTDFKDGRRDEIQRNDTGITFII